MSAVMFPNKKHEEKKLSDVQLSDVNFTWDLQCNPSGYSFELHPLAALYRAEECSGSESHSISNDAHVAQGQVLHCFEKLSLP